MNEFETKLRMLAKLGAATEAWAIAEIDRLREARKTVFVASTGSGEYGDEYVLHGIYSSAKKAEEANAEYAKPTLGCPKGGHRMNIEETQVDPPYDKTWQILEDGSRIKPKG